MQIYGKKYKIKVRKKYMSLTEYDTATGSVSVHHTLVMHQN